MFNKLLHDLGQKNKDRPHPFSFDLADDHKTYFIELSLKIEQFLKLKFTANFTQ